VRLKNERATRHLRNRFAGEIILRGAESSGGDDDRRSIHGFLERFNDAVEIVSNSARSDKLDSIL
jgi:hypothetical protein